MESCGKRLESSRRNETSASTGSLKIVNGRDGDESEMEFLLPPPAIAREAASPKKKRKRKVQWRDRSQGNKLVDVQEFQPRLSIPEVGVYFQLQELLCFSYGLWAVSSLEFKLSAHQNPDKNQSIHMALLPESSQHCRDPCSQKLTPPSQLQSLQS